MTNVELYECFVSYLTSKLSNQITDEYKKGFLEKLEAKRNKLYLQDDELALNMAQFCNMAGKLTYPLYFDDKIPMLQFDNGFNFVNIEELSFMDSIIKSGRFALYKLETDKSDKGVDRIKMHYYYVTDKKQDTACEMFFNYDGEIIKSDDIETKFIFTGWVRNGKDSYITKHIHLDDDRDSTAKLCEKNYCFKSVLCVYYFSKYLRKDFDFYIEKRNKFLQGQDRLDLKNIENNQQLIEQIKNPRQKHLYAFVEGERGLNQVEICNEISRMLWENNKIYKPGYIKYTMINLADVLAKNTEGIQYKYQNFEIDRLYVLTGVEEFCRDAKIQNNILYMKKCAHLIKELSELMERRYILILGDDNAKKLFFDLSEEIKFYFKNNTYKISNLTPEEMYEEFYKQTRFQEQITPEFKEEFLEYISLNHDYQPIKNQQLIKYLVGYCDTNGELTLPESRYKKQSIDEQLKDIIGLEQIKDSIREFKDYIIFMQKAKAHGKGMPKTNFHMIYTGNPGTGKTTIARIMASLLYQLGVIKENKLIEVERKDLIGQYIGQTAPKTADVIRKAMGGVLFIDEAYSLSAGGNNDYGKEAVATLIKAMEDHSDELVVIFAGYQKEMNDFLAINPGIASRIGYNFVFTDYTPEELTQIYVLNMEKMGFVVPEELQPNIFKVMDYFSRLENFGNGRFVKKYIQETLINHSRCNPNNYDSIFHEDLPDISEMASMLSLKQGRGDVRYDEESLYTIAVHESGHAFVDYAIRGTVNIEKIVLDSNNAGNPGYVSFVKDQTSVVRRSDYIRLIKTYLAGMCAEVVFFGEPSDGNSYDLRKASDVIQVLVTRIGAYDDMLLISDTVTSRKEEYMNSMLNQYYQETIELIRDNKDVIEQLAKTLLEKRELSAEEFTSIIKG